MHSFLMSVVPQSGFKKKATYLKYKKGSFMYPGL